MTPWLLRLAASVVAGIVCALGACSDTAANDARVLRIGHFPNVTHAQGLVARATARRGEGFLEQRLGDGIRIQWFEYNAGPSAMEALIAGSLDATYVGPSPALNAHLKTHGKVLRVLAGAARGGSALVVRKASGIAAAADLRGRRIATPQLGNTQDVACRAWLKEQGFHVTLTGDGDVKVQPIQNPDQLAGFQKGDLDAAWTVEPWVSRLELEGDGRILVEEAQELTTILVASTRFLEQRPELARKLVAAHQELTAWIVANPDAARADVKAELQALTKAAISDRLLAQCWPRLRFSADIDLAPFTVMVEKARAAGFFAESPDLQSLLHRP